MKITPRLLLTIMLGLAGHLARPGAAEACGTPSSGVRIPDTPINGLVVMDVHCSFGTCVDIEVPDELPVLDKTTGEMVTGTIVHSEDSHGEDSEQVRIVWKPGAPLAIDHTFEVLWQPPGLQEYDPLDYQFISLPALTWTAADIAVTAGTSVIDSSKREVECELSSLMSSSCGDPDGTFTHSIGLDVSQRVELFATIDHEASPADADGQYLVKTALWGEGEEQPVPTEIQGYTDVWLLDSTRTFDTAFSAYCYRVEVTSLIDDTVAVTEDCLPHTFGTLATTPLSDAEVAEQLGECVAPPDGYDDLWCMGKRTRCEETPQGSRDATGCDTAEELCETAIVPDDQGELDDASEPIPANPQDSSDLDDDSGRGGDEAMMNAADGCSATSTRRTSAWPSLVFAMIFLGVRARRARKSA